MKRPKKAFSIRSAVAWTTEKRMNAQKLRENLTEIAFDYCKKKMSNFVFGLQLTSLDS